MKDASHVKFNVARIFASPSKGGNPAGVPPLDGRHDSACRTGAKHLILLQSINNKFVSIKYE